MPVAIVMLLVVAGFVSAGRFVAAALSVLVWIHSYETGKHPSASEQLYQATKALKHKAKAMKDKVRENGRHMQNMAREVTLFVSFFCGTSVRGELLYLCTCMCVVCKCL
ncbi:hypothetical protein MRB53_025492 [Persea americana]|uniref:Uncharacterized protein n=1 Tax=Persea americana TaxID=3435 RepID=A0ACC2LFD5_PERAE|nr:hypothetical protein MRB53_025492 [Persea americana]